MANSLVKAALKASNWLSSSPKSSASGQLSSSSGDATLNFCPVDNLTRMLPSGCGTSGKH